VKTLHPIVRAWHAVLAAGVLVQVVATFGPWPQTLLDTAPMKSIYDGVLLAPPS
jgi:hypothetical protein